MPMGRRTTSATSDLLSWCRSNAGSRVFHAAASAQVGTLAKGRCRSKSAVCCDNTEVRGAHRSVATYGTLRNNP